MTLKIRTADIELEYTDEYSIIEAQAKNHILEIIDKIYAHQINAYAHQVNDKPLPHMSTEGVFGVLNNKL